MTQPAHFFDLGGTLLALSDDNEIATDEYGRVTVLPGVRERLVRLAGSLVFVVTNQAGIAEGTLTSRRLASFWTQLATSVNGVITAHAVCTHARDAKCGCRKPRPGLVLGLADTHRVNLAESVMIGDTDVDRRLTAAAGIGRFFWAKDYFAANDEIDGRSG
jgi:D-glycero-D-manno-heptose 1,7-bisphosphate phosphatase